TAITVSLPFHVPATFEILVLGEFLSSHAATVAAIAHTISHRRIAPSLKPSDVGGRWSPPTGGAEESAQAMPGRRGIASGARASESPAHCPLVVSEALTSNFLLQTSHFELLTFLAAPSFPWGGALLRRALGLLLDPAAASRLVLLAAAQRAAQALAHRLL